MQPLQQGSLPNQDADDRKTVAANDLPKLS